MKMGIKMADQGAEGLFSPFLRSRRLKAACPYIKGRVLDVGCGTGALAGEEHKGLLDRSRLEGLAVECDLKIVVYLRFLLGANQLVVFQQKGDLA